MINQVTLAGNTGSDVELQMSKNDIAIAYVRLATTEKYNGVEKTTWHNIKAFSKLAETMAKHVSKGRKIMVQGRLDYYSWEKDGVKQTKSEIIVEKMFFLGSNMSTRNNELVLTEPTKQKFKFNTSNYDGDYLDDDDDIPF
jgi:single-strand DNA-binding protein